MNYSEDQVVFTKNEFDNLLRLIMTSETEYEVKENLIMGLSHIFNPKVFIIEESLIDEE